MNLPVFDFVNGGASKTYIAKIDGNTSSYSITGRLTKVDNFGIPGGFVEVANGQGYRQGARTDSLGFYSLINLPAGDYTVTPSRSTTTGPITSSRRESHVYRLKF